MKFFIGLLAVILAASAIYFVLQSEKAVLIHPKGLIAHQELKLIKTNILLMLTVVAPTIILLYIVAWKYRAKNSKTSLKTPPPTPLWVEEPGPKGLRDSSSFKDFETKLYGSPSPVLKNRDCGLAYVQSLFWIIPSIVVAVMAFITWGATFRLDPYKPIISDTKPLTIQVIALDWKWLFIYPEQKIATVNLLQFPEKTPIRLELSADGAPMNSFWIPQLSGQIYTMTGMITPLHIIADGVGQYSGKAAEINGDGYASMTFIVKSTAKNEFDRWAQEIQQNATRLDNDLYHQLLKPSINHPIAYFSSIEEGFFNKIVHKYMHPHRKS